MQINQPILIGIVFYYGILQLIIWWVCHVSILFWKIRFPFHARSFDQSGRTKYIHVACILVSLLVPLTPVLAIILNNLDGQGVGTVGFTITRFPPLLCSSPDANATFYALVVPVILVVGTGLTMLVFMLWFLHKVLEISQTELSTAMVTMFLHVQQTGRLGGAQNRNPLKIGTAEKKLLVIIIYYILLAVLALTTFTIFSRTLPLFTKRLFEYFVCEQDGSGEVCSQSGFQDLTNPAPANMSFVLLALNPWLNLIFTVNIKELKKLITTYHMVCSKTFLLKSQSSSGSANTSSQN